jgi:hypothetical protein
MKSLTSCLVIGLLLAPGYARAGNELGFLAELGWLVAPLVSLGFYALFMLLSAALVKSKSVIIGLLTLHSLVFIGLQLAFSHWFVVADHESFLGVPARTAFICFYLIPPVILGVAVRMWRKRDRERKTSWNGGSDVYYR